MAKADLTAQRLRELLHYDPATGIFTWLVNRGGKGGSGGSAIGSIAGSTTKAGYVCIKVDSALYKAHRLAWLYANSVMPAHDIDHINGIRDDNRLVNLRDAPRAINAQNLKRARKDSKNGFAGVRKNRNSGWAARIRIDGKERHLGIYPSAADAHAAYIEAKRRLHAGCTI